MDACKRRSRIHYAMWFGGLLACYILFFVFWPIALLPLLLVAIKSVRVKWWRGVVAVAVSPFVLIPAIAFASGAIGYASGTARLQYAGLPGKEFFNLDPEIRCYRSTSGCLVDGTELFTHLPNNAAVRLMYSLTGPMKGTYHGPYPSRDEVFAALRDPGATPCPDGQPEGYPELTPPPEARPDWPTLRCAPVGDACVAVGTEARAALYAAETGERFAVYVNRDPDPEMLMREARDGRASEGESGTTADRPNM